MDIVNDPLMMKKKSIETREGDPELAQLDALITQLEAERTRPLPDYPVEQEIKEEGKEGVKSESASKRKMAVNTDHSRLDSSFSPRKKLRSFHGTEPVHLGQVAVDWSQDKQKSMRATCPRFFERLDDLEMEGELESPTPRIQYAFWLLQLVEDIFDARYQFELGVRRGVGKRKKIQVRVASIYF